MAEIIELKEQLRECVKDGDFEASLILKSLCLIPEVKGDLLLYTPTRPDCGDADSYINVIGPDDNVYPMYLQRLIKRDGLGAYFNVKPLTILKKFVADFNQSEVLSPHGDGRSPQRIIKLPLTLDFYDFFNCKDKGLESFLVFLVSYLYEFEDNNINIFRGKKPKNKCTGFGLNCPFADVLSESDLLRAQRLLVPYLESLNFKEKQRDEVVVEQKKIVFEAIHEEPIEVLVEKKVRLLEYCSECSAGVGHQGNLKLVGGNDATEKMKWSYSDPTLDCEVIHFDKGKAYRYFCVLVTSMMNLVKGEGHNHLTNFSLITQKNIDEGVYQEYGEDKVYSDMRVFVKDVFISEGMKVETAQTLINGNGVYIVDVPLRILKNYPFFGRNQKKLYLAWDERFDKWSNCARKFGMFSEVYDSRFGRIILWRHWKQKN